MTALRSMTHRTMRLARENGLVLAMLGVFAACMVGQIIAGWGAWNEDLARQGAAAIGLSDYLGSGHFISAVFENWESEFLQMAMYVTLTIWLRQKGSPESKPIEGKDEVDADPRDHVGDPDAPWPVRRGSAILLTLYSHSLSISLIALFVASFVLHLFGSLHLANDEAMQLGQPVETVLQHLASPQFWFESFQNWQSEFFALGVFIWLTVVLRQRGSAESKPVAAPNDETGG
ncbi:MAG: DUF6766 family protein [Inquilinus sp.]|uniref:DUF6766 family protein n=1 Tax=Inquilinus sp. TaxID=1932117 RepID=UPI003F371EAA